MNSLPQSNSTNAKIRITQDVGFEAQGGCARQMVGQHAAAKKRLQNGIHKFSPMRAAAHLANFFSLSKLTSVTRPRPQNPLLLQLSFKVANGG